MVHFTKFRPFHEYTSYYPYYLPSYYSRFYPRHYQRYFEPTTYWLERRQPHVKRNIQVESNSYSQRQRYMDKSMLMVYLVLLAVVLGMLTLR
jgi:hypothetical protein